MSVFSTATCVVFFVKGYNDKLKDKFIYLFIYFFYKKASMRLEIRVYD